VQVLQGGAVEKETEWYEIKKRRHYLFASLYKIEIILEFLNHF